MRYSPEDKIIYFFMFLVVSIASVLAGVGIGNVTGHDPIFTIMSTLYIYYFTLEYTKRRFNEWVRKYEDEDENKKIDDKKHKTRRGEK
jgi:cell division protein FtsW (lipid II flippase)